MSFQQTQGLSTNNSTAVSPPSSDNLGKISSNDSACFSHKSSNLRNQDINFFPNSVHLPMSIFQSLQGSNERTENYSEE